MAMTGFGSVNSTTHKGNQKESHPPMCWVLGKQISIPAVNPERAHELAPAPLLCSPRTPEYWIRQPHTDERAFVEVQEFNGEIPEH